MIAPLYKPKYFPRDVSDVIHGYGGMFPMHGPLPPYGMIMEYKRLLEGAALPGSLNYQYIAANYFQLHSK